MVGLCGEVATVFEAKLISSGSAAVRTSVIAGSVVDLSSTVMLTVSVENLTSDGVVLIVIDGVEVSVEAVTVAVVELIPDDVVEFCVTVTEVAEAGLTAVTVLVPCVVLVAVNETELVSVTEVSCCSSGVTVVESATADVAELLIAFVFERRKVVVSNLDDSFVVLVSEPPTICSTCADCVVVPVSTYDFFVEMTDVEVSRTTGSLLSDVWTSFNEGAGVSSVEHRSTPP